MFNHKYDLAVVGGGVVGAALVWLAGLRFPSWRTVWLDKGRLGSGASLYSGGLVSRWGTTDVVRRYASRSLEMFSEFESELGGGFLTDYRAYLVCSRASAQERLSWFIETPPEPVRDHSACLEFVFIGDDVAFGPFSVARLDAFAFVSGVANWARHKEIEIYEGVEIANWREDGYGSCLLTQDGVELFADRAVFATGPWGPPATSCDGPRPEGRVKRVAACHISLPPASDAPVVMFGDKDSFLLPQYHQKRWLLSFRSAKWDVSPQTVSSFITPEDRSDALAVVERYVPQFSPYVFGGQAFCDLYSEDRSPAVHPLSTRSPVLFAGMCSGSGTRLCLGIAEEALHQLQSKESHK